MVNERMIETSGIFRLERAKGIEPSYAAWEAAVLPLNYARIGRETSERRGGAASAVCQPRLTALYARRLEIMPQITSTIIAPTTAPIKPAPCPG